MNFLEELNKTNVPSSGPVLNNLWGEYQKIVLRSLITTFGLDFIIKDRVGGDVDTVHTVRDGVQYKNPQNELDYQNRGKYDSDGLHRDKRFRDYKKEVKGKMEFIEDQYSPGKKIYLGKSSFLKQNNMVAECDHSVSGREVHDDPGRVLAGLDTNDLANRPENFYFTNKNLNRDMSDTPKEEYVKTHEDSLTDSEKEAILSTNKTARNSIDKDINDAYYSSEKFYIDSINAAHSLGVKMGIREAVGFIMVELFFSCKTELENTKTKLSFSDCVKAIQKGVSKGVENIKSNYKFIFTAFGEGYISGLLASLSTTFINIFLTTDKLLVKNIRTASITLVRASNVLFFNPGQLFLGDRLKTTAIILSTGACSMVGTTVGTYLEGTPIREIPLVGDKIITFIQILVSGLLSGTFLYMLDRSEFMTSLTERFNKYAPEGYKIHEYCNYFERLAAELEGYDVDEYSRECEIINYKVAGLNYSDDELAFAKELSSLDIEDDDLDAFLDGNIKNFKI